MAEVMGYERGDERMGGIGAHRWKKINKSEILC